MQLCFRHKMVISNIMIEESSESMENVGARKDIPIIIQITDKKVSIPNRNFREINNQSAFSFLLNRLKKCGYHNMVISTTDDPVDDRIFRASQMMGCRVYRGSFSDVPNRLLGAAELANADNFVRILGNCLLVDIDAMDRLYWIHVSGKYDYSFNENLKGVIRGTGCEVFNSAFLEQVSNENLTDGQKQTIGMYIRQQSRSYNVYEHHCYDKNRPNYKLNLESEKDYEVITEIATHVNVLNSKEILYYLSNHPILSRYNLEVRPKEVGLEKIFFNLDKAENIVNSKIPDLSYPVSVEMTLTNVCNLNCVYCSDAMLRKRQGIKEMISLDDIDRLFKDLSVGGTKGVVLEGGGEPTMYQYFNEVVDCAVSNGLAVGLITNGVKKIESSILKKFEWIRVSLDASTPEEYNELKGVDCYEKVIDNISNYVKYCPTVGVGYVVTSQNVSQIEALVLRLRELKVAYVQFRPVVDNDNLYPNDIDLAYLEFYASKDFGVQVDGMSENAESGNHGFPCYASSITSIISGDGSVYICGRLNVYDWIKPIGNIINDSFHDIWYGEERKRQIEMISDADFCSKNCPQCRISKFNLLFHKIHGIKSIHFI